MTSENHVAQAIEAKLHIIGQGELHAALQKLSDLSHAEKQVLIEMVAKIEARLSNAPNRLISDTDDARILRVAKELFDLE